jgi:hypothetical protein
MSSMRMADVLRVISGSPTDVQPVFDSIVANAVRLCGGRMSAVFAFDGELVKLVAHHNCTPEVNLSSPVTEPAARVPSGVYKGFWDERRDFMRTVGLKYGGKRGWKL